MTSPSTSLERGFERLSITELNALGDEPLRRLLAEFLPLTHASEIAIWAKDPAAEQLVALFDTSGPGGTFEMKVTQPLATGIVSQVYREQKPFLDRGIWRSRKLSPLVDKVLNQVTQNEMCVPFFVGGQLFGVMSAVQLTDAKHDAPSRWGFDELDLKVLGIASSALGQALERAWLSAQLKMLKPLQP